MIHRWTSPAILVLTLALAYLLVSWGDREFLRIEAPALGRDTNDISRSDWIRNLKFPYRRLQNDWLWACVAATVGLGVTVVADGRTWRRPVNPGSIVVLVTFSVLCLTVAHFLLAASAFFRSNGICYGLRGLIPARVTGAVIGARVATWGRRTNWQGRFVLWICSADLVMLVAQGLLFG